MRWTCFNYNFTASVSLQSLNRYMLGIVVHIYNLVYNNSSNIWKDLWNPFNIFLSQCCLWRKPMGILLYVKLNCIHLFFGFQIFFVLHETPHLEIPIFHYRDSLYKNEIHQYTHILHYQQYKGNICKIRFYFSWSFHQILDSILALSIQYHVNVKLSK